MVNELEFKRNYNIALMGGDRFARHGITTLLQSISPCIRIEKSDSDCLRLDNLLTTSAIDILFISGAEKYHASFDFLSHIKTIKENYPEVFVCMYSTPANSLLWVHGEIDAYISLQDPLYHWRASLLKMVDSRYRSKTRPMALSLTPGEWRVLKKIRNGLDIRYIAELEKLSYRRVSALKNSAIRKLGLRNKTDLLVFLTS